MIFLLLPAVAVKTAILQFAPIKVRPRLLLGAPEFALLATVVLIYVRLAPKVLPIVSIFALISVMVPALLIERTPHCFKVEHVEVIVLLHVVQHVNAEFLLCVCESAEIAKLAAVHLVRPLFAELGLVLLGVIEIFHPVVGLGTVILQGTSVCLCKLAQLRRVRPQGSSPILFMIVDTLFLVVSSMYGAWLGLEDSQI